MKNLPIFPDLPDEYIEYYHENRNLMIFNNRLFIKCIFQSDTNIDTLMELQSLKLKNFHNHKQIFTDEFYLYYYLISDYLNDKSSLIQKIKTYNQIEILKVFKNILISLENAHDHGFYPFDISYQNYLIGSDNIPIFIDFDTSFYHGKCTYPYMKKTIFDISFFGKKETTLTEENLSLNDRMLTFSLLLNSLIGKYQNDNSIQSFQKAIAIFKEQNKKEKGINSYLEEIAKGNAPKKNDYFLDSFINPLLDSFSYAKTKNS